MRVENGFSVIKVLFFRLPATSLEFKYLDFEFVSNCVEIFII